MCAFNCKNLFTCRNCKVKNCNGDYFMSDECRLNHIPTIGEVKDKKEEDK